MSLYGSCSVGELKKDAEALKAAAVRKGKVHKAIITFLCNN